MGFFELAVLGVWVIGALCALLMRRLNPKAMIPYIIWVVLVCMALTIYAVVR